MVAGPTQGWVCQVLKWQQLQETQKLTCESCPQRMHSQSKNASPPPLADGAAGRCVWASLLATHGSCWND